MPKADPIEFDALPSLYYFKSNAQAAPFVRQIDAFPDALGMDSASGGFLVLHRRHSMSGLEEEMPVALILKKLGHRVLLLEEVRHVLCPDVQVDGLISEIKRISRTKRLQGVVLHQFRTAYRKCHNLILHIDQPVRAESLRTALFIAVQRYSGIKLIWLIVEEQLWQLQRKTILNNEFRLK